MESSVSTLEMDVCESQKKKSWGHHRRRPHIHRVRPEIVPNAYCVPYIHTVIAMIITPSASMPS
jgi:hypothetical protein